jgi:hypothetical protein
LLAGTDWHAAADRYAQRHDADYLVVSKVTGWFMTCFSGWVRKPTLVRRVRYR